MPYQERIKRVQQWIRNQCCDALLIENKIDLFYLTGLELSAGKMVVAQNDTCLIVDKRYFERCKKSSAIPVLPAETHAWLDFFGKPPFSSIAKFAFDSDSTTYHQFLTLADVLKSRMELIPFQSPVKHLRMIKDASEIHHLEEAAVLGAKGFDYVCTLLKEGISENEIANELEIYWKRLGSKGLAFDPIIAFGANSSMPHYRAGEAKLQRGQTVLIDIGVNFRHYHSDMTRTLFFGEPDPKIAEIYEIVKGAQKAALQMCRPGTCVGDLDEAARAFIRERGYGENFTHSLGHGVGLEIHELPVLRNKPPFAEIILEEGMVITIEPGIYLEGIGGVRLEDTIVIQSEDYKNLTNRPLDPYYAKND